MGTVFLILFVTRSMTVPSGQIHPQKNLPSTMERMNINAPGSEKVCEALCREKIAYANERISAKEAVDGNGDFIFPTVVGEDKENKKKSKKYELRNTCCRDFHNYDLLYTI